MKALLVILSLLAVLTTGALADWSDYSYQGYIYPAPHYVAAEQPKQVYEVTSGASGSTMRPGGFVFWTRSSYDRNTFISAVHATSVQQGKPIVALQYLDKGVIAAIGVVGDGDTREGAISLRTPDGRTLVLTASRLEALLDALPERAADSRPRQNAWRPLPFVGKEAPEPLESRGAQ